MINKTILYGTLVADPESRYTKTGKCICSLRIAHNLDSKDGKKEPLYISVDVWDKQGEACVKTLKKGSKVVVDGRLTSDTYENKDGKKVTKMFIVADRVNFIFEKTENGAGAAPQSGSKPAVDFKSKIKTPSNPEPSESGGEGEDGDDIPF